MEGKKVRSYNTQDKTWYKSSMVAMEIINAGIPTEPVTRMAMVIITITITVATMAKQIWC